MPPTESTARDFEPAKSRQSAKAWRPLAFAIALLLRLLAATWRVEYRGHNAFFDPSEAGRPQLNVLWHRGLFAAAALFRGRDILTPVSFSRDGDRISAVLERLGFPQPIRGSSSRGGTVALRRLIRSLRAGGTVAILADGPRGPARHSKIGVVALARHVDAAIAPVAFSASRAWVFDSWDATFVPLPFARVVCAFGEPVPAPRGDSDQEMEEVLGELDRRLEQLTDDTDRRTGFVDRRRPVEAIDQASDRA